MAGSVSQTPTSNFKLSVKKFVPGNYKFALTIYAEGGKSETFNSQVEIQAACTFSLKLDTTNLYKMLQYQAPVLVVDLK